MGQINKADKPSMWKPVQMPAGRLMAGFRRAHTNPESTGPKAFVPKSTPLLDTISAKRSLAVSDQKTRRFFLGALTAASAVRVWGANDKVNVGIVGLGGRGSSHLNTYTSLNEAHVVALCDVNQAARERAQATLSRKNLEKAREFEDMRQMYADPKVEAVSIATPNHWHALSSTGSMKPGKVV